MMNDTSTNAPSTESNFERLRQQPSETGQPPPTSAAGNIELLVLLLGIGGFTLFVGLSGVLLLLAARQPVMFAAPSEARTMLVSATVEPPLPAPWTPAPTAIPTGISSPVFSGRLAVHLYQPRPDGEPLRLPTFAFPYPAISRRTEVLDLARIMEGESRSDLEAAYMVGWVAKNRLRHGGYGESYRAVSSGFFGYRPDVQPSETFIRIAERVIRAGRDPTRGCLFALSRTDITNLGIPPQRADVAYGEWFFFLSWPLR